MKESDHLEKQGTDENITLKYILKNRV